MRREIVAAAMVATLALVGCSGNPQEGQTTDDAQEQIVSTDASQDADESEPSFEETQQAVIDYLNSDETHLMAEINPYINDLIDYGMSKDGASADAAKESVYALCNRIIDREDVPEPCEELDKCLKSAAEAQKECSYYYAQAANESDADRVSDYISMGTESLNEATMYIDEATMHISDLKDRYDIVTY